MQYSRDVEEMVCVKKGAKHEPAPIPEEGKWVKAKEIKELIETHHPDAASIEAAFANKNIRTTMLLSMARGAAAASAAVCGVPIYEYSPKTAKRAAVGMGTAAKEQVASVLAAMCSREVSRIPNDATDALRKGVTASIMQESGGINVLTAQLKQDFRLGILNWENVVTYQNSSNKEVLPLPALNLFSNLYLKFMVVRQLTFEIGGDISFFTKYNVPDFCPQLNQFAIQQNAESRVELGGYPFVDVYANMHLKRTRFFIMYSHVTAGSGNRNYFLTPHYPMNGGVLRFGVSWNFFN